MSVTVYTTGKIEAETLAAGLIVMEAWRAGGVQFPQNFTAHPGLGASRAGEGYRFNAGTADIRSPVTLALHRGGAAAQEMSLAPGQGLQAQIAAQLESSGPTGTAPRPPGMDA